MAEKFKDIIRSRAVAAAWWEGVNAQWRHRPIGNRIPETENPFGRVSGVDENTETAVLEKAAKLAMDEANEHGENREFAKQVEMVKVSAWISRLAAGWRKDT